MSYKASYIRLSTAESILIDVFKPNSRIGHKISQGEFRGKSLSQGLLYLKELGELSEDILFQVVEQTHKYHLDILDHLQSDIDSYRQKRF